MMPLPITATRVFAWFSSWGIWLLLIDDSVQGERSDGVYAEASSNFVMSAGDSSQVPCKTRFQATYEPARRDCDREIEQAGQEEDVEVPEGCGADGVRLAQQLGQTQRERKRTDLEDQDGETHQHWERDAQPLRDEDEPSRVHFGQTQGVCGF